ncbi:MAG: hypothetical protein HY078_15990 [Elusimicrobia bacterium]|nr:hypothetical protein [Elusimicrobiota bacterium]
MSDTVRVHLSPDYFPLRSGRSLRYAHTSSEFEGVETVDLRVVTVSEVARSRVADIEMTRTRMGEVHTHTFRMVRSAKELRSEDGVLGHPRVEFPIPPVPGTSWIDEPDRHELVSLDETLSVPAGTFDRCLRVNTYLAAGDAGSAIRYYAPEVGYIYEDYAEETRGSRVKLISFSQGAPTS